MKVLVYGSGGRDHCLADSYGDSQHVDKVYLVPGNPGVRYTPKGKRGLIELVNLEDFKGVADFCKKNAVDLGVYHPHYCLDGPGDDHRQGLAL